MNAPRYPLDQMGHLDKIGDGGQGVVYRSPMLMSEVPGPVAVKIYKPHIVSAVDTDVLDDLALAVRGGAQKMRDSVAWPAGLVLSHGEVVGIVMPRIPDHFTIDLTTANGTERKLAEFQHLLNSDLFVSARGIRITIGQRLRLLAELAEVISLLHRADITIGDFSPKNILFALRPSAHVGIYLIDCDSMALRGRIALPVVETPGWKAAAGESAATPAADVYKFALLVIRTLAGAQDAIHQGDIGIDIGTDVAALIAQSQGPPAQRPEVAAWVQPLRALADVVDETGPTFAGRPIAGIGLNVAPQRARTTGISPHHSPPPALPSGVAVTYGAAAPSSAWAPPPVTGATYLWQPPPRSRWRPWNVVRLVVLGVLAIGFLVTALTRVSHDGPAKTPQTVVVTPGMRTNMMPPQLTAPDFTMPLMPTLDLPHMSFTDPP